MYREAPTSVSQILGRGSVGDENAYIREWIRLFYLLFIFSFLFAIHK